MALFFKTNVSNSANGNLTLATIAEAHAVNGEVDPADTYWCAAAQCYILIGDPCYTSAPCYSNDPNPDTNEDGQTYNGELDYSGTCWYGGASPDCVY
ncbi:hypothetical protein PW52_07935 [Tamlana sedimentorum]|uniref:Uncharacterized protein n=1 Tax=Neotamlana sedimentorum TaxID=1435349 RepID=A0A0D7W968_9FLAO|nr:hypothetical protein [Tamlana sedimentorum]KJD35666.1 hypothetical protein PW52_07935 [Tamlana sedimentorum]